jgi:hypothetical protein
MVTGVDGLSRIEELVRSRLSLSVVDWILDLGATLRGRAGQLPIDAECVARTLRVAVADTDMSSSFGATHLVSEQLYRIEIASDLTPDQRNFTIAHELGHVMLHRLSDGALQSGDDVELFCDLFGAHLLCPLSYLHDYLSGRRIGIGSLSFIASELNMPFSALAKMVARHYPVTYFWGDEDAPEHFGPYPVAHFRTFIEKIGGGVGPDSTAGVSEFDLSMFGCQRWKAEVIRRGTVIEGLLKPFGTGVMTKPTVRSVTIPREHLLKRESGVWTLSRENGYQGEP